MAIARYAGVGTNCPAFQVTVVSGGALTTGGNLYLSFQLQNRVGFNIPAVSSVVSYAANQKIIITIPAITSKPAWDIHYFVISAGTTADPSTHVQIARYHGYKYGLGYDKQTTKVDLPATIELSRNAHVALAPSVATIANLPTGSDRIDGQIRWVTNQSRWLEYRADSELPVSDFVVSADVGQWVQVGGASTYVGNPGSDAVGSDRPLSEINPTGTTVIPTPPYPGTTLGKYEPTWEARYFIYNDQTVVLPAGTEFGVELEYNNKRSPDLLSSLFLVRFDGFVQSDGTYRTTDVEGRNFPNLGAFIPWSPRLETPFTTIDDLQPGEAIALAVKPFFSVAELNNEVTPKAVIGVIPVTRTRSGDYNPLGKLLSVDGDLSKRGIIYDLGDKYRVVPNTGLTYDVLRGAAIVASYDFPIKPRRTYGNLSANLAGQKVIINGNAAVFTALPNYQPTESEAIRAIVGTVAGESVAGSFSSYLSGGGFSISIAFPVAVRSNYPDVLAGSDKAIFNAFGINLYIQRQDTLEIKKFSGFSVVPGNTTQVFEIADWESGTVASLPVASADFSLFAATIPTPTAIAGNFPATNFRIAYSFQYNGNQITSISHVAGDCIREWDGDFQPASVTVNPNVTTLTPGSQATVTQSGTSNQVYLTFSIPGVDTSKTALSTVATDPSTGNELAIYNKNNELYVRLESNGSIHKLAFSTAAQQFTATQSGIIVTSSGSGNVVLDGRLGNIFSHTVTGVIADLTISNIQPGATYIIYLIQGATGYAVTLNSVFKRLVGDDSSISTEAGKINILTGIARSTSAISLFSIAVEV